MNLKDWIIFENEDFIALNKPAGLLSIPDRKGKDISLKQILQEKYKNIFTVHRLDRETSGIIVFAKNEIVHKYLSIQFEERAVEKFYLGLVLGSFLDKNGMIEAPISEHPVRKGLMTVHRKGKDSLTGYEVVEGLGTFSWVKFQIFTGRTHQVRIHAKHIGHPIACDELYGDGKPILISSIKHKFKLSKNEEEEKPILNRLALHSHRIKFNSPGGKIIELEALLPKDLKATLQQLRKWKK